VALTERALNRATLARQLLLERERVDVAEAVRRIVAMQAQEPASPYVALWNRVDAFDPADLDRAFADGAIVKSTLMRVTVHAVTAGDHGPFRAPIAGQLRASRVFDRRFDENALTADEIDAAVPELLAFLARPRNSTEIEAMLGDRFGERARWAWWALKTMAPIAHAVTGAAWSFGPRPSYRAAVATDVDAPQDAGRTLARRYLEGFGPASVADFANFTRLARSAARAAFHALGDEIVQTEGPGGAVLYDVPGGPMPADDTPAPPRLMAMWDSVLLAYDDRSRIIPETYRRAVIRSNGDVLPTLLVDGLVAGVWRPVEGGIEATAFHGLDAEKWRGLEAEATALRAFIADRDPFVYRRYGRWWAALPAAEVRVLGG
jgi:Winged helix DNA-binding domain